MSGVGNPNPHEGIVRAHIEAIRRLLAPRRADAAFAERLKNRVTEDKPILDRLAAPKPAGATPCPARTHAVLGVEQPTAVRCGLTEGHDGWHIFHVSWGPAVAASFDAEDQWLRSQGRWVVTTPSNPNPHRKDAAMSVKSTAPSAVEVTAAVRAIQGLPAVGPEGWFGQSTLMYREDVAAAALTAALPLIEARIRFEIAEEIFGGGKDGQYKLAVVDGDLR